MYTSKPFLICLLGAALIWAFFFVSCAQNEQRLPDPMSPGDDSELSFSQPIDKPPTYELLAKSLEYYEKKLGITFARNEKGYYFPYCSFGWDHFSLADRENHCLYDVKVERMRSFQHLDGQFATLLELKINKGPCGINYPNVNVEVLDKLQNMEGAIVNKYLLKHLRKGTNFISDDDFIQESLQVPWRVESSVYGFEPYLARHAQRVENPLDITFGDIVFFSEYIGEWTMGIYAGYGLVVSNCCFRTQIRRLDNEMDYRTYRLYSGFGQVKYKVHHNTVLHQFLQNPE